MRNQPVHWYEGQFLRPHHFQASDRHWSEYFQTSQRWDHPFNYGLQSIDFSQEALANHQFQVHHVRARMPDGTLVSIESDHKSDRIDLKEAFETNSVLQVYLGVPKLKMGRANVARDQSTPDARYLESKTIVQDESQGSNDQEVHLRDLNVRLLLSTQEYPGYDLLPIAQIKRAGEGEAKPQIDDEYIPPMLSIDAWPGLGRDIIREIYDIIGQKIEVLSQQVVNRGIGLDSRHPGDLDRVLMLSQLNAANSSLAVLSFAQGVHPFVAYTELCRIAGQLAIFGKERRLMDIPAYDHEDLVRIFTYTRRTIEQLIHSVRDYEFQQRYFIGVGMGMQVSLEPQWFNSDWQWFIGVKKGDLTQQECRDLLSPGQLDWKLGSSRQVEVLFQHRSAGVELMSVDRTIRALPAGQDWIYYEITRKDTPAWRDVHETQTLAMRLKDSLILNLDRLQGERHLAVSFRGKRAMLEFALFAVPIQK